MLPTVTFFFFNVFFAEVYSFSADRSQHLLLTLARNETTGRLPPLQMSDLPMTPRGDDDDALQEPNVPEKFSVRIPAKVSVLDRRRRPPPPPQPSPSPSPPPPPPRRRQTRERRCRPPAAAARRGSARSPRYFRRARGQRTKTPRLELVPLLSRTKTGTIRVFGGEYVPIKARLHDLFSFVSPGFQQHF